ncbi:Hsp20/alpha crystallin family protein [Rhodoferax sediminis]|jgi:HSP20 family protein|uniref:Hsp20/alpha crystallin family protein n=1 Tax=Rhodoferax sediminis TaxID=2509614 RepID=A0A515DBS5_9BURK|nr:Hsp20/alpha crystallin family protein [Rhodoferax sediminis]QDL37846.1 Hsp20/alpha crystallin family protein [Rhodoferax sediminis]
MTKLAEQLKQGADQAWESLSEGWRELSARASGALTRFWPTSADPLPTSQPTAPEGFMPRQTGWAFMAADVFDDADKVIVRIEAPGMRREDIHVELNGDMLTVWGEKRIDREATEGRWRAVQCAYGSFRRDVALPVSVKADKTQASYRDGVLRIQLPKSDAARARRIEVQTA